MAFEKSLGSRFEKPFFGLLPIKLIQLLFSISFSTSAFAFSQSFALFIDVSSISVSCSKANSFSAMTNTKKPPSTHRPQVIDGCPASAVETSQLKIYKHRIYGDSRFFKGTMRSSIKVKVGESKLRNCEMD